MAESNEYHAQRLRELYPVIDADHLRPAREAMTLRLLGRAVGVDRVLDDGDVVDLGSDVKLTVVHEGGPALVEAIGQGWPGILSSLKSLLETGLTLFREHQTHAEHLLAELK